MQPVDDEQALFLGDGHVIDMYIERDLYRSIYIDLDLERDCAAHLVQPVDDEEALLLVYGHVIDIYIERSLYRSIYIDLDLERHCAAHLVQPVDDEEALFLVYGHVLCARRAAAALSERRAKPVVEAVCAREDLGQQEVEQRPELVQRVLEWRARQQDAVRSLVLKQGGLRRDGSTIRPEYRREASGALVGLFRARAQYC